MTSENILSGLCHLEDSLTRVARVQIDWGSEAESQAVLFPAVPAVRGVCHKEFQSLRDFCDLNLHCFVRAGKVPFQY